MTSRDREDPQPASDGARERGRAVYSGHRESRWSSSGKDHWSGGDDDPGGWNGGHDQGEPRPAGADAGLTGFSGDSVRTQGVRSNRETHPDQHRDAAEAPGPSESHAGTGSYGGGRGTDHALSPEEARRTAESRGGDGPIPDQHYPMGWGDEGQAYAPATGPLGEKEDPARREEEDR